MHHLMHRAYWAFKNLSMEDGTPTGLIYGSLNILLSLAQRYHPKDLILCYDGGSDRRKAICSDYKANRSSDMVNGFYQQLTILRQLLDDLGMKQTYMIGEEADDIIGTLAKRYGKNNKVIIVSGDHDFLQLITENIMVLREGSNRKLYTKDMVEDEYGVSPEKLEDVFCITGDGADNIKGIKGIGIKGALKLIVKYKSLDTLIESSSMEKSLTRVNENKKLLLLNRRLIRIVDNIENIIIDKRDKKIKLVKKIFNDYFKFTSFIKRWSEFENFSNIGGDDSNKKSFGVPV